MRAVPGSTRERVEEGIQMLTNKFIAIALGVGLLISLALTFSADEVFILLAAFFG